LRLLSQLRPRSRPLNREADFGKFAVYPNILTLWISDFMSSEIFYVDYFLCRRWKSSLKQLTQMGTVRYEFGYNHLFFVLLILF
jgi:hypothetical protein